MDFQPYDKEYRPPIHLITQFSQTVGASLSITKVNKFFLNTAVKLGLNQGFTAQSSFYDFPFMNLGNCCNVINQPRMNVLFSITEENEGYESLGSGLPSQILLHKWNQKSCDPVVLIIICNSIHRPEKSVSQTFCLQNSMQYKVFPSLCSKMASSKGGKREERTALDRHAQNVLGKYFRHNTQYPEN